MYLLTYVGVGIVLGWFGSVVMESDSRGMMLDFTFGIVGALVGGFIFDFVGNYALGYWDSVGTSIIGAILFLIIESVITHSHKPKSITR